MLFKRELQILLHQLGAAVHAVIGALLERLQLFRHPDHFGRVLQLDVRRSTTAKVLGNDCLDVLIATYDDDSMFGMGVGIIKRALDHGPGRVVTTHRVECQTHAGQGIATDYPAAGAVPPSSLNST